jgi:hypothetical protein
VRNVKAPLYEWPGLDVFSDLGPIPIKDQRTYHFDLQPITEVKTDPLIDRAKTLKARMEGGVAPATAPPAAKPAAPEGASKPGPTK